MFLFTKRLSFALFRKLWENLHKRNLHNNVRNELHKEKKTNLPKGERRRSNTLTWFPEKEINARRRTGRGT